MISKLFRALVSCVFLVTAHAACNPVIVEPIDMTDVVDDSMAQMVCDLECACKECDANDYDKCQTKSLNDQEKANTLNCLAEYEAVTECKIRTSSCENGRWKTDCKSEKDALKDCQR